MSLWMIIHQRWAFCFFFVCIFNKKTVLNLTAVSSLRTSVFLEILGLCATKAPSHPLCGLTSIL